MLFGTGTLVPFPSAAKRSIPGFSNNLSQYSRSGQVAKRVGILVNRTKLRLRRMQNYERAPIFCSRIIGDSL